MAKRDNLKTARRKLRRVLNRAGDAITNLRGGVHRSHWGTGIATRSFVNRRADRNLEAATRYSNDD